ncbi:aldehyde ferredoxin oxidoreductase [Candidatus Bathyarchaeota archaeon]|nr:MAG: aldehyde ferredoxin oxidoreductase [Candidatus Bathyarchaeota archaeon]
MEYYGWAGTILRVDLTKGKIRRQPLPKDLALNFIGGRGFNSKILYDEVDPNVDAFSPENKLIFGTGPCTGTLVPCSGRWTVTAKSPSTEAFGDANAGGHWGAEMKWAGYDCIVFEGAAKEPVYLWIDDDHVELRDASHLWGLDTWETTDAIRKEHGDLEIKVACIGPAGENLIIPACVISDYTRGAGKCGMGAVMGSKRLKAIAIRGTKGVRVAHPEEFVDAVEEGIEILRTGDQWWFENFSKYGTPIFVMMFQTLGCLPTYNWREGVFEGAKELSGETLLDKYVKKKRACHACVFHCSGYYVVEEGPYAGAMGEGIEYEATGGFGSKLGNADLASTCAAKTLCDKMGIDLINCTDTVGWAMECYEKGILTSKETDGLDMSWGNAEAILEAIRRMAYREGRFGELLAMGSYKASKVVGKGAERYSITIKGQQMGLVDPRVMWAWGLGFGTSTRGGDHLRTQPAGEYMFTPEEMEKYIGTAKASDRYGWEGKGMLVAWYQNIRAVHDSLEMCKYFFRGEPRLYVEFPPKVLTALTGFKWTYDHILRCGERIYNVEKAFNVKVGLGRKDDYLPERFYKEPYTKGPYKGAVMPKENYDKALDEYYRARGWDLKTSNPTRARLEELGLKYIADELEKMGRLGKE